MICRSEAQSSPGQFYHEESKWIKVMLVSSIPIKVMFYNQSDTKFLNGHVHSMQCKKLNLKSNCIEFCNSTTYSIECKSDLGRLTVCVSSSKLVLLCCFPCRSPMPLLVGWLVGLLVGWLVGWLVGLPGRFVSPSSFPYRSAVTHKSCPLYSIFHLTPGPGFEPDSPGVPAKTATVCYLVHQLIQCLVSFSVKSVLLFSVLSQANK